MSDNEKDIADDFMPDERRKVTGRGRVKDLNMREQAERRAAGGLGYQVLRYGHEESKLPKEARLRTSPHIIIKCQNCGTNIGNGKRAYFSEDLNIVYGCENCILVKDDCRDHLLVMVRGIIDKMERDNG